MGADLRFTALGTPWNISIDGDYDDSWRQLAEDAVRQRLERFERIYSRFRPDSLVSHIKTGAAAGGFMDRYVHDSECLEQLGRPERLGRPELPKHPEHPDGASERVCFPDDAAGLFRLYDLLFKASEGRIDPCAGADLEALGYGRDMVFDIFEGTGNADGGTGGGRGSAGEGIRGETDGTDDADGTDGNTDATDDADGANEAGGTGNAGSAGEGTCGDAGEGTCGSADGADDANRDGDIAPTARHHQENDRKERDQQKRGHRSATNITAISIAEGTWATLGAAHHPTWGALRKGVGPCELRIPAGHVRPALDFGACGKGYAVDLAAQVLERMGARNYVIEASGDLRIRGGGVGDAGTQDGGADRGDENGNDGGIRDNGTVAHANYSGSDGEVVRGNDGTRDNGDGHGSDAHADTPGSDGAAGARDAEINRGSGGTRRALRIALEDPTDPTMAVGVATVRSGSFCASGVGRRRWHDESSGAELHHILDAVSGTPTRGTIASWTFVPYAPNATAAPIAADDGTTSDGTSDDVTSEGALLARDFPTAVADGLATALFLCDPVRLRRFLPYDFMLMHNDRSVRGSAGFPAHAFLT